MGYKIRQEASPRQLNSETMPGSTVDAKMVVARSLLAGASVLPNAEIALAPDRVYATRCLCLFMRHCPRVNVRC